MQEIKSVVVDCNERVEGQIYKAKPLKICSYTTECQGDTKGIISLSKKIGIFRGVGILQIINNICKINYNQKYP